MIHSPITIQIAPPSAPSISSWMGEVAVFMECDLLRFAKRLSQQLSQLSYQENRPAVPPHDYQLFQATLSAYEQGKCGKKRLDTPKE